MRNAHMAMLLTMGSIALILAWFEPFVGLTAGIFVATFTLLFWNRDVLHVHRGAPIADGGEADIEMIVAIIRPAKLNDVKRALAEAGAPSLTVTNVSGRGSQPTETGQWRGSDYVVDLHQKVKIECAVTDSQTATVVDAIQEAAFTGKPGDGKIFVMPVYDACRVSTDERGVAAM